VLNIFKKDFPNKTIVIGYNEKELFQNDNGQNRLNYPLSYYEPNEKIFRIGY